VRSLRARLIAGAALVAVVPLALAIALLSQRVGALVRQEAGAKLGASLGGLSARLVQDRSRIEAKLAILARDPTLKRLYLVRGGGSPELGDYLAERRFLLGLDFLVIADAGGRVVAGSGTTAEGAGADTLTLASAAPILYDERVAGLLRGGVRLDAAFLGALKKAGAVDLTLRDPSGRPIASTLPAERAARLERGGDRGTLSQSVPLEIGPPPYATLTGWASTDEADRTIAAFQIAAALLGLLGLAIAVALALVWSAQLSRPVEQLAAFARKVARGEWGEPLRIRSASELQALVAALETMRGDLADYRERLVTSERQAAWSLMARKVAHEVKNPLTPIAVSVADLKRSYDQQRPDFPAVLDQAVRTISEEVASLKRILQEFSEFARLPAPRPGPCSVAALFADVGSLYAADVARGRVVLAPPARDVAFRADADQIRQVVINLLQNGLEASGAAGAVTLAASEAPGSIEIAVTDAGPGLSEEERRQLFVPGFTTKAQGSGLGLTIAQRIVHDHGGSIAVESEPGRGTAVRVRIPLASGG
jgi:two-component system nitrogen regulation sensor histidine kinase NtrY